MKVRLNIIVSNAQENAEIALKHTGVWAPTSTIIHAVEVEIPDLPRGYDIDNITLNGNTEEK